MAQPEDITQPSVPARRKITLRRRGQKEVAPPVPVDKPGTGQLVGAAATRIGSSWLGSIPAMVPGVGTAIGGAIGGVGELAAQAIEEPQALVKDPVGFVTDPKRLARAGVEAAVTAVPGGLIIKGGKLIQSGLRSGLLAGGAEYARQRINKEEVDKGSVLTAAGAGALTGGLLGKLFPGKAAKVTKTPAPSTLTDLVATYGQDIDAFRQNLPNVMYKEGWSTNFDKIMAEASKLAETGHADLAEALRQVGLQQGHWTPQKLQQEIHRLVARGESDKALELAESANETRTGDTDISKWIARTKKEKLAEAARTKAAAERAAILQTKKELADKKLELASSRLKKFKAAGATPTEKASVRVAEVDPRTGETITHVEEFKPRKADDVEEVLGAGPIAPEGGAPPAAPKLTKKESRQVPPTGTPAREIYDAWRARGRSHKVALHLSEAGRKPLTPEPVKPVTPEQKSVIDAVTEAATGTPSAAAAKEASSPEEIVAALQKSWGIKAPRASVSPRQAQPFVPVSLADDVTAAGKAAQGAAADAGLINQNMPPLPGAGGTKAVPEARDAVVEALNRRVGPQTTLAGGRRSTDLPAVAASAAKIADDIPVSGQTIPDTPPAKLPENLDERLAALEATTPRATPEVGLGDRVTSGQIKAARKRETQLQREINDTQTRLDAADPSDKPLLRKQMTALQKAANEVKAKITELEATGPTPKPPVTQAGTTPPKVDITKVMSPAETQDIADSIMNARTGELGVFEQTAAWRAASKAYHTAKARGDSFAPDPRGTIDPSTGSVALIPLTESGPRETRTGNSLGAIVAKMGAELENTGVLPKGFGKKISEEIKLNIEEEARKRWQDGIRPSIPENAPVTVEPTEAGMLPGLGGKVDVPETVPTIPATTLLGDVSPELSKKVESFRQGVIDGTIPPDQAAKLEQELQKELLEEAAKDEGFTAGSLFGGAEGIRKIMARNPDFATKAIMIAGGALTGAVADPLGDPVLSGILGASMGAGGTNALKGLKALGVNIADDPQMAKYVHDNPFALKEIASTFYRLAPHIQRANYLMSAYGLPANAIAGPVGSGFFGSLTKRLAGDPRGGAAAKEMMNPKVWFSEQINARSEALELIKRAAEGDPLVRAEQHGDILDRVLRTAGPMHPAKLYLQGPAIMMAAGDIATRRILLRNGFSEAEARAMTLTSEPMLPALQSLMNFKRRIGEDKVIGPVMDIMFPFVRTPLNIWEQGLMRMPGLGPFVQKSMEKAGYKPVTPGKELIAEQAVSSVLLFSSYLIGLNTPKETASPMRRFVSNIGGQYSLITGLGFAMGQGAQRTGSGMLGSLGTPEAIQSFAWGLPLPVAEPLENWWRFAASGGEGTVPPGSYPIVAKELDADFNLGLGLAPKQSTKRKIRVRSRRVIRRESR